MRIAQSEVKGSPRPWVNPFARVPLPPTTRLSEHQLTELNQYVKASATYKKHKSFFESCDPDSLILFAAAYYFPQSEALEIKIQKISGLTSRQFEALGERLQKVASEITRLNQVDLPGVGATFTGLLARLAASKDTIAEMDESLARAERFDGLPRCLLEYSRALKEWPGPNYRKSLSDRNSRPLRLAQLCLVVEAITNDSHYREIASLLNAVAEFAWERFHQALDDPITHDLVGHNVKNFRDRNPDVWPHVERLATIVAERCREERANEKNPHRQQEGARTRARKNG